MPAKAKAPTAKAAMVARDWGLLERVTGEGDATFAVEVMTCFFLTFGCDSIACVRMEPNGLASSFDSSISTGFSLLSSIGSSLGDGVGGGSLGGAGGDGSVIGAGGSVTGFSGVSVNGCNICGGIKFWGTLGNCRVIGD